MTTTTDRLEELLEEFSRVSSSNIIQPEQATPEDYEPSLAIDGESYYSTVSSAIVEETIDEVVEEEVNEPVEAEIEPTIPENSPSLLISESTSRFSSATWYDNIQHSKITLAGLGGIGSYVAFLLARMNPLEMHLYDFDEVELVNMSGQFYRNEDIGMSKLQAVTNMIRSYANYYKYISYPERFTEASFTTPILFCGFDNMSSRKSAYERWKSAAQAFPKESLFIDGRLAAEEFQVFCIQGTDTRAMELYEKEWLFSDEEAEETLCSYKQTTFMANMIGSVMVNLFVNFMANKSEPLFPRDIPFLTEYDASRMYFKVEM